MTQHWYDTFFRGIAVDFWRTAIPHEMTAHEVEFLRKALSAGPGRHLLDVPCGAGRHLIPLALLGCRMTGVDISEECLAATREDAALAGDLLIELRQADMRDLPWEREFDGACCCGNSFGYMDATGAEQFVRAVYRTLKPDSVFVLETGMAAESILPTLRPGREMEAGEITVRSETHYHATESRLDIDYTFERDGVSETRASSHYVLTAAEIRRLLERAGFSIESIHGDMAEPTPYELGSQRLVIVART
jgi:SAM-dependent methyltransferase